MTNRDNHSLSQARRDKIIERVSAKQLENLERSGITAELRKENEIAYFQDMLGAFGILGDLAPPVEPTPGFKARLLKAIPGTSADQPILQKEPLGESALKMQKDRWRETGYAGISYQLLFRNEDTQVEGVVISIEAGSTYPAHHHHDPEFFYIIEGDLQIERSDDESHEELFAGEFQFSESGSSHGRMTSPSGCIALVISSGQGKFLEPTHGR